MIYSRHWLLAVALPLLLLGAPASAPAQAPDLAPAGYAKGDPEAPVLVVEFGDFGCSACAQFARGVWPAIEAEFVASGRVRWIFVPVVLGPFPNSREAARAAECAHAQEAFWTMHDWLFLDRKTWMRPRRPRSVFTGYARELGLDAARFERCYGNEPEKDRLERSRGLVRELGIRGTPTFFIDGKRVVGALPLAAFRALLEAAEGR